MGLCKCQKRKVTNLFCFEHDVNVCEYCLVSDHERCIVQSYVQWLQDSDYNPICVLCKNLLKDEPTVRLICYDVFHLSCLDKYATQLPSNTAPAGYQCPKCKECLFPPPNLVSPLVDVLKQKLENFSWSKVGFDQPILSIEDISNTGELKIEEVTKEKSNNSTPTDDESNGFVIVNQKNNVNNLSSSSAETLSIAEQQKPDTLPISTNETNVINKIEKPVTQTIVDMLPKVHQNKPAPNNTRNDVITPAASISHIRSTFQQQQNQENDNQVYDGILGVVVNVDNSLDRDTGENKYKRRPLLEWFSRWLRSRQLTSKIRITRQKKILFIIIFIFLCFFTMIIIFSRLGSLSTENDPALDPLNNPNIRNA